jgi:molybdenum cofactor cytidylyltransferase
MITWTEVLRPETPLRLALVGAGGKTSAMFSIARSLPGPVLLTTTTHLGAWQAPLADRHLVVHSTEDLRQLDQHLEAGCILITGGEDASGRLEALDSASLQSLLSFAKERSLHLLIEADGSRQKPLKAPAEYEPVIPADTSGVIVVAGLSGLGEPLDAVHVHRPERLARLSGLIEGEAITPEAIARVLTHPDGGLKNIPQGARRFAVLNQANTEELQHAARRMAGFGKDRGLSALLDSYEAVIVGSTLPETDEYAIEIQAVYRPAAGIILAAGDSKRFRETAPGGRPKQLISWKGVPLVRHAALAALEAGLQPVVVVVGAFAPLVSLALEGLPVQIVENPRWAEGMGPSMSAGINSLPTGVGAAIVGLVDMPQVSSELYTGLVELHARTLAPLAAPRVGERRANPALFDRSLFPALRDLQGDVGGRKFFEPGSGYTPVWLPWPDETLLKDIDTWQDFLDLQASQE